MKKTAFLLIRVTVQTSYQSILDAIRELESETVYSIGSTKNVEVLETQIIKLNTEDLDDSELN